MLTLTSMASNTMQNLKPFAPTIKEFGYCEIHKEWTHRASLASLINKFILIKHDLFTKHNAVKPCVKEILNICKYLLFAIE